MIIIMKHLIMCLFSQCNQILALFLQFQELFMSLFLLLEPIILFFPSSHNLQQKLYQIFNLKLLSVYSVSNVYSSISFHLQCFSQICIGIPMIEIFFYLFLHSLDVSVFSGAFSQNLHIILTFCSKVENTTGIYVVVQQ